MLLSKILQKNLKNKYIMKTVILTSGPRGAGKTTYIQKVKRRHPEISIVSRDKLALKLLGRTAFDPYTFEREYIAEKLWEELETKLKKHQFLILDLWNGYSEERKDIIKKLREKGVETIICWYFITPLDIVMQQGINKPLRERGGITPDSLRSNFLFFHKQAQSLKEDGFDKIISIDPHQLMFKTFAYIT